MSEANIILEIVEKRKKDIEQRGYNFGFTIPEKRTRPVNVFMKEKGAILEIKRASPSKGNIAPELNAVETAKKYRANGAKAISCLTEENYFKGNLQDLMNVCNAVPDIAVLRKDFLIDEEEIDIAYRCGADAVLLISGILSLEKMLSMLAKCKSLGIRALVEVRTEDDAEKVIEAKKQYSDTIVCGVNSRNLKDFSIDLLVPAMLKQKLGGQVIFESGITTPETAVKVGKMGFAGILLGEFAARNPEKAGIFVNSFVNSNEDLQGQGMIKLASVIANKGNKPLLKICGLTRAEDVLLADSLGADFTGFIFAAGFGRNVCNNKFDEIKKVLPQVKALKVAVVTNLDSNETNIAVEYVKQGILDFIQFHGIDCTSAANFANKNGIPYYFAITEKNRVDNLCDSMFSRGEARYLQDLKNQDFEANLIGKYKTGALWIAGGITPENIKDIVEKYKPELVDISSGIEDKDATLIGIKNPDKLKKIFSEITKN